MTRFDRLTPLLKSFVQKGPAGCACLVAQHGETLYEDYEGFADIDTKSPIKPDTIYRIFSMSKLVTCTAALMIYERGLYLLNDPLYEYLPEFKDSLVYREAPDGQIYTSRAARPILIKDLFTMRSGLTYGGEDCETARHIAREYAKLRQKEGFNIRDFSRMIATVPLKFDPGDHYTYSFSHDVLGALIEVISGKTFGEFLRQEIFEPLQMNDTSFRLPKEKKDRFCSYYTLGADGSKILNNTRNADFQPGVTFEAGGQGLLCTIGDYSRLAQMLAHGGTFEGARILSANTVHLMATNHLTPEQVKEMAVGYLRGYGYGLGVRVMMNPPDGGANSNIGEFGWSGALGTWVLIDPSLKLTAVYMQQLDPHLQEFHQPRLRSAIYGSL